MNVAIENGLLIINLPVENEASPSSTEKTLSVAQAKFEGTGHRIQINDDEDRELHINVNAYVYPKVKPTRASKVIPADIEQGMLLFEVPVNEFLVESSTGKTYIVAQANGVTSAEYDGKPVHINVLAFLYKEEKKKARTTNIPVKFS